MCNFVAIMSTLEQALTSFFEARPQLCQSGTIVVGLSGGRDSLSLLHWLAHAELVQNNIVAVYVDHGLRPEAAAEGELLAKMIKDWGVEFRAEKSDLTAETFSENAGRMARYGIFETVAKQVGATAICTGHHAGDQAETVLLHLLRGSGLTGLTGIQLESERGGINLIRPMLQATPEMIVQYAAEHELTPLEDPSNQEMRFARNRIRHDLLPKLAAEYNPQIGNSLGKMAHILQDDWAALEQIHAINWQAAVFEKGDGWCAIDWGHWESQNGSYQRYAIRRLYAQLHGSAQDLTLENLESARLGLLTRQTDKKYQLSGTIVVQFVYGMLVAMQPAAVDLFGAPQLGDGVIEIDPFESGCVSLENGRWQIDVQPVPPSAIQLSANDPDQWSEFLSIPANGQLTLRGRQPGEKFQPFGMNGQVSLKKLMIDRKIPAVLRDQWPLVADNDGVLWVAGHRLAQRAAITPQTNHAVQLTFSQLSV